MTTEPAYDPRDWFWRAGDRAGGEVWSSAVGAYVPAAAADPARTTRIGSAAELSAVLLAAGLAGPVATAAQVRAEAQRRIIALMGADTLEACLIRQLNAAMRATELVNKRAKGEALSAADAAEEAALEAVAAGIKAIRAASNAMEQDPPADFASDGRWP